MTESIDATEMQKLAKAKDLGLTSSIFSDNEVAPPGHSFEVKRIKSFGSVSYFFVQFEIEAPMQVVSTINIGSTQYVALRPPADQTEGDMVAPVTILKWCPASAKLTVIDHAEFLLVAVRYMDKCDEVGSQL